jgi:hypothetical protein
MPAAVASADQLPNRKREQDRFGPRQRRRSGRRARFAARAVVAGRSCFDVVAARSSHVIGTLFERRSGQADGRF